MPRMGPVTKLLLLLAVVVPVAAYVAGTLASPGSPAPTDHSPVILRDAPATEPATHGPALPEEKQARDGSKARVVTPQPTPVGEDDDDEWDDDERDDDGPDDDTETDERDD